MQNGKYLTRAELANHLAEHWMNNINYRVENNPTHVYQLIQSNFPGEFQSLANGSETTEGSKELMNTFLERKATSFQGGPAAFAAWIYAAVPFNRDANNWTTQIK